ncbi:MAG: YqgE/AlgH family protein [Verrucomicrobiales bacterium]
MVGDLLSGEEFAQLSSPRSRSSRRSGRHYQLTLARLYWNEQLGELDAESHLSAADAKRQLDEGFPVFAFVGYSGWSGGQLEEELQQNAWIVRAPAEQVAGGGSEGKAVGLRCSARCSAFITG